ncbi:hypothetical protein F5877DRAFT_55042 [Lentinula edodes]|nr:hypothetical protein F5877DRAFT_55042 [Lentinula edodes]
MLTWLRSYLDLSPDRAIWTYVADALMAHHVPKSYKVIDKHSRINIFLQSWNTEKKSLPKDLQDMINVATRYGLRLEVMAPSREIIRQMPIWLHSKANGIQCLQHKPEAKCLRQNHKIRTVGDTEELTKHLRNTHHHARRNCACPKCRQMREDNCRNPHKCYEYAKKLIETLPPKWNPLSRLPEDHEPQTQPLPLTSSMEAFDYRVTTTGTLADVFRIFTEGECNEEIPMTEWDHGKENECIEIYTDGSCTGNGTDEAIAGAGIYVPNNNALCQAIRLPIEIK